MEDGFVEKCSVINFVYRLSIRMIVRQFRLFLFFGIYVGL